MIKILRKEDCTGYSACVDICAQESITLETDFEGFWYPELNPDLCINCDLCEKICHLLYIGKLKAGQNKGPKIFAAYYNDMSVRRVSTSGGIFSALAEKMYDENGYVDGTVYIENFLLNIS